MPDGLFLSLDGIDGTGKSTQCALLADRLRLAGLRVTACADPGGTDVGARLREILLFGRQHRIGLRTEALLFLASRAELVEQVIRPALGRGEVVVSDRFTLANVVYQGHAGGLDPEAIWQAGRLATGGLEPDLTLVFDLPVGLAVGRRKGAADRVESRGADYQSRVREGFLAEARRRPDRFRVIDAAPPVEVVREEVWRVASDLLRRRGHLR